MNLLSLYEKLETLLKKLPEGLHQPILREIEPIKTLFLQQRPPRVVLLGDRSVSRAQVVNALFGDSAARIAEDITQSGQWEAYSMAGRGTLRLLDARLPIQQVVLSRPLGAESADLFLFVQGARGIDESFTADLEHAAGVIAFTHRGEVNMPPVQG